jgi:ATP-dependent Clp protease ATP-binding subunit ClpC
MRNGLRKLLTWFHCGRQVGSVEPRRPTAKSVETLDDRFTDRLKNVLSLANEESRRLNHEYIGTEHLLMGLVKEGSGVAALALKELSGDVGRIQRVCEKVIIRGPEKQDWVGKRPMTPRAKRAIDYAREEARNLNHDFVGTEHLLLGLLREPENFPVQVLLNLGIEPAAVRQKLLSILGRA